MNTQRPKVTLEMITQAAQKLATENGWDAEQVADVAKHWRSYMDGYELAKELDSYCSWVIVTADVEALECMGSEVSEIHRQACLKWAVENEIKPPLPIGTMTTKGEIVDIYRHNAACYLIREHGETNDSRRLIVKFEDAKAAQ